MKNQSIEHRQCFPSWSKAALKNLSASIWRQYLVPFTVWLLCRTVVVATSLSGGLVALEAASGKPAGPKLNPKTGDRALFTSFLDGQGMLLPRLAGPLHLSWPNKGTDSPQALSGELSSRRLSRIGIYCCFAF